MVDSAANSEAGSAAEVLAAGWEAEAREVVGSKVVDLEAATEVVDSAKAVMEADLEVASAGGSAADLEAAELG